MANLLKRVAAAIAGPRRPRSHAIDPAVMEAGRWMEDIRREQYGVPGEIVRAMVIAEVRVKPDDEGTAVIFATDRSQGYYSAAEASGLLAQAELALGLIPHAQMLQSGMNQLGQSLVTTISNNIERGAAEARDAKD